jgi:hypothetical protein
VDKLLATNKFTAEDIAGVVYKILTARQPRLHYMVGFKLKLMVKLRNIIPSNGSSAFTKKLSSAWWPIRAPSGHRPQRPGRRHRRRAKVTMRRKVSQKPMIDLHTHTDRSDGSASPAQLVHDAKAMGLEALGITDHDTLDGYDTAAPVAAQAGPGIGLRHRVEHAPRSAAGRIPSALGAFARLFSAGAGLGRIPPVDQGPPG